MTDRKEKELERHGAFILSLFKNADKRTGHYVFIDIYNGILSYIEEIKLMKHITVGETDSIDVLGLLLHHIESTMNFLQTSEFDTAAFIMKLRDLKINDEKKLCRVKDGLTLLRNYDQGNIFEEEHKIFKGHTADFEDFLSILEAIGSSFTEIERRNLPDSNEFKQSVRRLNDVRNDYCDPGTIYVKEISKRTLGKMLIKSVGNEGQKEKEDLRKLFQTCIDYLRHRDETYWSDASFTIYSDTNLFKVKSGLGKHQFICSMGSNGPIVRPRNDHTATSCNTM